MSQNQYHIHKQNVRRDFNKAAATYDGAAVVQQEVCTRLLERLELIKATPAVVLDVGAGTGQATIGLARQYPEASIISLDLAEQMLHQAQKKIAAQSISRKVKAWFRKPHHFVCADAERLPFADASFDLIFSNLTIQWCADLPALFKEFRRVIKPGGFLMFTTLGPDTLKELRLSWAAVSDKVHVNQFADMHDIGDALYNAQTENPVIDTEFISLHYPSIKNILKDLKAIGAHNQNDGREHALTGKARLQAMYAAYQQFRTAEGSYPMTYEVIYGHAWIPATPLQYSNEQQTSISLAQLKSSLGS